MILHGHDIAVEQIIYACGILPRRRRKMRHTSGPGQEFPGYVNGVRPNRTGRIPRSRRIEADLITARQRNVKERKRQRVSPGKPSRSFPEKRPILRAAGFNNANLGCRSARNVLFVDSPGLFEYFAKVLDLQLSRSRGIKRVHVYECNGGKYPLNGALCKTQLSSTFICRRANGLAGAILNVLFPSL